MNQRREEFRDQFRQLFDVYFQAIRRYLNRLSGDPDLAADLAQETFIKLYRRGSVPDSPEAWLITVAMNLFRNASTKRARRRRLLTGRWSRSWQGDPPPSPDRELGATDTRLRVRAALDRLPERERSLLLLRAEGFSYRDLGQALEISEASVGTLLSRARQQFRESYGEATDG